jgi:competence ComEA-like helix-hairpin-helix protein
MLTTPTGRINLPIGMILRSLPPEVLAADLSEFEASGAAATEIGLPMNLILGQLPSGKVEIPLGELVPHFPAGYLQPTQSIASYLPNLINLPLMDVVMRIPPDLLALRPDQKDIDSSVINMADPFTEEILREQAEAARRQAPETNIIDESQVTPAEEFVPRDRASSSGFIPPLRPTAAAPMVPTPPAPVQTPSPTPIANRAEAHPVFPTPPRPRTSSMPPPPTPARPGSIAPPPPPVAKVNAAQPPPVPIPATPDLRPVTAIPARPQAAVTSPVALPQPTPGTSAALPTPALARPTTSLPMPPRPVPQPQTPQPPLRPTVGLPQVPASGVRPAPVPAPVAETPATETPVAEDIAAEASPASNSAEPGVKPGEPDAAAGELQRLAALAMAQEEAPAPEPEAAPAPSLSEQVTAVVPNPSGSLPSPTPAETDSFLLPATQPSRPFGSKSITARMPSPPVEPAPAAAPAEPEPAPASAAGEGEPSVALNLNSCTAEELLQIPGCDRALASSIIAYRAKTGSFKKLEDLLEVPGMSVAAYRALTGEAPPQAVTQSVAELLGFPADQKLTLKDVTERIGHWPDVTGCVLSQKTGLHLVGHVPAGYDRAAIVAFAPRIFESVNKSFGEITSKETDELIIPTTGTSFHIFRNRDLYLIILCRLPQMPDRHAKIARLVLGGLGLQRPN